jgi:hypothetical protein
VIILLHIEIHVVQYPIGKDFIPFAVDTCGMRMKRPLSFLNMQLWAMRPTTPAELMLTQSRSAEAGLALSFKVRSTILKVHAHFIPISYAKLVVYNKAGYKIHWLVPLQMIV